MEHQWTDRIQGDSQIRGAIAQSMGLLQNQRHPRRHLHWQVEATEVAKSTLSKHDCRQLRQLCHLRVLQRQRLHTAILANPDIDKHPKLRRARILREGPKSRIPSRNSLLQQSS